MHLSDMICKAAAQAAEVSSLARPHRNLERF
jgi:hypothetical protein